MKITFEDFYYKAKEIIKKTNGGAKNSKLGADDEKIVDEILGVKNNQSISGFSICMPGDELTSNSAQKALVEYTKKICSNEEYKKMLEKRGWFYDYDDIKNKKDVKKRYGNIYGNKFIYKDSQINLIMVKIVKMLLDCNAEDEISKCSYNYDLIDKKMDNDNEEDSDIDYDENVGEDNNSFNSLPTKEILDEIKRYIDSKGFVYDLNLIENFYLSLSAKPFVILAGISGTGKTKIVKLFSEAIGAEYKMVSVRPDWSDSSDLFGHTNLQGEFVPGAIIDYLKAAIDNPDKPYILCLDEMNLARVEYYFSDFLSLIETRKLVDGRIVTDPICIDGAGKEKYGDLYIPDNLFFVGTVNMDETTYPFSKKVLDRANTIEFSDVEFVPSFDADTAEVDPIVVGNDFLATKYLTLLSDIDESQKDMVVKVCTELQSINEILKRANLHVGYRVRDEIVFYMLNNDEYQLLKYENAFDFEIMQKILPRIQGSTQGIKDLLIELFKKCAGDYSSFSQDCVWMQMNDYLENKASIYPMSAKKICYMMRRFEEDGFTSYWL